MSICFAVRHPCAVLEDHEPAMDTVYLGLRRFFREVHGVGEVDTLWFHGPNPQVAILGTRVLFSEILHLSSNTPNLHQLRTHIP